MTVFEETANRLRKAVAYLKGEGTIKFDKDLAEAIGADKNTVSQALMGNENYLTPNFMKRVCDAYSVLNYTWIVAGEGSMLKQPNVVQSGSQNIHVLGNNNYNIGTKHIMPHYVEEPALTPTQKSGIPLIPFDGIAGYGEDNTGIKLNNCEWYNIPEFENIGADFLVRVGGSSMYPKYSSGDILACRKIHDILFFQWGKIYVVDSSQGQLIKRIFEHENEDLILLVSDNHEKYPPFSMPKADIRSLSIVLGAVKIE